jgi:hypothetical protein
MNVILVGGTGAIGQVIAKHLDAKNFQYISFTRNIENSYKILPNALSHIIFKENNRKELLNAIEQSDAIINLAGASIAGARWTDKYKQQIYESRINSTNFIASLINEFPTKEITLVSTSAIGIYGDRGDELLFETSSLGNDFLANLCKYWEKASNNVHSNVRVINPRVGVVLDNKTGALPKLILPYKFFIGGAIGSGKQWYSWIHIDDLAKLYVNFLENKTFVGTYNAVAPNPATMLEFAKRIGSLLHRPSFFKVPEFILNAMLGESSAIVLASQRVSSEKLQKSNFNFNFNHLDEALNNLLR